MNSAKKEKTAQLSGLFTGDGLRKMLERKDCFVVDIVFSFVPSFVDKPVRFEAEFGLP